MHMFLLLGNLKPELTFDHCQIFRIFYLLSGSDALLSICTCDIAQLIGAIGNAPVNGFRHQDWFRCLYGRTLHSSQGLFQKQFVLRQALQLLSQMLMELEVEQQVRSGKQERTSDRKNYRNSHRQPTWKTRVGEIDLAIAKLCKGSYFSSLLDPSTPTEKALLAAIQET